MYVEILFWLAIISCHETSLIFQIAIKTSEALDGWTAIQFCRQTTIF